jgi:hypothetical protein
MTPVPEPSSTPERKLAVASRVIDESFRGALLARVLEGTPSFFGKTIIDPLLAYMGGAARRLPPDASYR